MGVLIFPLFQAHFRSTGALDDARYAASRCSQLRRGGKSARFIQLDLKRKYIAPALIESSLAAIQSPAAALSDAAGGEMGGDARLVADLRAAVVLCRKKRIGPFTPGNAQAATLADRAAFLKALQKLATAGYSFAVARKALGLTPAEAAAVEAQQQPPL